MAGPKRALEVLPAIVACGVSFAGMQFYVSNYIGPELTDIVSSLTCIVVMVLVLKLWKPRTIMRLEGDRPVIVAARPHSAGEVFSAWLPYLLLVVFVLVWGDADVKAAIEPVDERPAAVGSCPRSATLLNGLLVPGPAQHDSRACRRWSRSRRRMRPSSDSTG